ncbi:hypothetical protein [Nonomuraea basaltis]|uniref:hypothetical protein n=1 Tax=Nonomuraea basaltis TaxID=2495887 RepID=UPI001F102A7C|nr:hypothetical protein [Nonomuraea basaltis]
MVVPQIVDQPYWAGRVAELGIGAAHDGPTPTLESLSVALRTALTPALLVMAARFAMPVQPPCYAQWLQATSDRS